MELGGGCLPCADEPLYQMWALVTPLHTLRLSAEFRASAPTQVMHKRLSL